jgi:GTP-binding protein
MLSVSRSSLARLQRFARHPRSCCCGATRALQRSADDDFLIRNARNDVHVFECPDAEELRVGLAETAGLPHICVAGESNAGKSSLINHLLKKKLARASSVAGKTRSVDMLEVNSRVVLTDLPGLPSRDHQVTRQWETTWRPLVMNYVERCPSLLAMLYVHDVRWRASQACHEFLQEIQQARVPVVLVLTKDDRIIAKGETSEHERRLALTKRARRTLEFDGLHLHYSTQSELASSRRGRRSLLRQIEALVEAGAREQCRDLLGEIAARKSGRAVEQESTVAASA